MNKALLTNKNARRHHGRDSWQTPQSLFLQLDAEFHFTLDAAAAPHNAKCATFFDETDDGLEQEWTGTVWCNPPYRSSEIPRWVRKGYESTIAGATVVMLVPVRTDLGWWHDIVIPHAEVRFIRRRVQFTGMKTTAPFASAVLIFRPSPRTP